MRALVAAILCAACQGQPASQGAGSGSGSAGAPRDAAPPAADAPVAASDAAGSAAAAATGERDEPDVPDPGRVIAELGAIPAWQAVVDRAQLLGRRGLHGVVYGRVGPAVLVAATAPPPSPPVDAGLVPSPPVDAGLVPSPHVWLIDDTDGNGALGIRIAVNGKAREGDRIAAGGAWQLDPERRWFWKPDAIQPLPPAPASDVKDPPPPVPGHAIATGALPPGARTASVARDNDAIYFQIVGPSPASDGDGWQIADQLGSPAVLVLNLPGERSTYGGQDMRAADERWQLRRGQTYWVRIGRLHKHAGKPTQVNARTAPIRVL
ncbi:MAG TPA: hypothetical protein VK607_04070 [Kofleriaceae bacterium]|nr:hypothetical protein [Kofleriaceae bacterium]